jgi:hypothetical protein
LEFFTLSEFYFAQVFALQNVLKWFLPLVFVTISFGDVAKLLIIIIFKEKVVGFLPNYFPPIF